MLGPAYEEKMRVPPPPPPPLGFRDRNTSKMQFQNCNLQPLRILVWASSRETLSSEFANDKGTDQPAYLCRLIRALLFTF